MTTAASQQARTDALLAYIKFRDMSPAERRAARDRAGLARRDVARTIDCSETIIRLWETNRQPSRRIGEPYAALLSSLGVL